MTELKTINQSRQLNKILIAALCSILIGYFILSLFQDKMSIEVKYEDLLDSSSLLVFITMLLIIAPIIEEIAFRYWITKPKAIFLTVMILFVGFSFGHIVVWVLCGLLAVLVFYWKNHIKEFILGNSFFTIIFSSVLFGLVHINNYTTFNFWIIIPIFILISLGVFLAVLRIKFGIVSAIAAHMFYNLLVVMPYAPPLKSQEEYHSVNGHKIRIQKLGIFESNSFNQRAETDIWSCSNCNEQTIINSVFELSEPNSLVVFENRSNFNLVRFNVNITDSTSASNSNLSFLSEDILRILNYSSSRTLASRTVYEFSCVDSDKNLWDGKTHTQLVVNHVDSLKIVGGKNLALKLKSLYAENVVCKEDCHTFLFFGINKRHSLQQNLEALAAQKLLTYTSYLDSVEVVTVYKK
jgi:membrane protease YdiL (CAAX protease family)